MELYTLQVFRTVTMERSFSRAAEKLLRTQPAISLAVQRLEHEVGDRLLDRSGKDILLTDAGQIVLDYARRFENLQHEMEIALTELRDNSAGRLVIGANESTTLYLLRHIQRYRRLYPKVKVLVLRSLSSRIPAQLLDGDLELGAISYDPGDDRLTGTVIYRDHLAFVVSPQHRFAHRESLSIRERGMETFIAHHVLSPYRETVLREFQRHKGPLRWSREGEGAIKADRFSPHLQLQQRAQPFGLNTANGDLRLLFVVHPDLVAGFEPWDDFLDPVDIHQVGPVDAPEKLRIEA